MNVDLARIEFAFVTINHFFFVPITIGLAFLTALLQTAWYRSKNDQYLRLTRFFGTLLVINVAIGVVTGLVQEFQFGAGFAFAATTVTIASCIVAIFTGLYPNVMVSATNTAYNLTVHNTASGNYTLKVMTVVALVLLPVVLAYQELDLLRIPPARQQTAIPGVAGAEYATGPPPPGSNTRCRSAASWRRNLTPHQYGRKLTWQPIKLTRW